MDARSRQSRAVWRVAEALRPAGAEGATLSAVNVWSQLLVSAKLARDDETVARVLKNAGMWTGSARDLMESVAESVYEKRSSNLERFTTKVRGRGLRGKPADYLLVWADSMWKDLQLSDILPLIDQILKDKRDSRLWAIELIELLRSDRYLNLGIPEEIYELMLSSLPELSLKHLLLPNFQSALAVGVLDDRTQEVHIAVKNYQEFQFVIRLMYLAEMTGLVSIQDFDNPVVSNETTGCLSTPAFGRRKKGLEFDLWPSAVGSPSALNSDAIEVVQQVLAKRTSAILVTSGFLFQSGATARARQWLVESGWLRCVVEFPGRMLNSSAAGSALLVLRDNTERTVSNIKLIDGVAYLKEARAGRFVLENAADISAELSAEIRELDSAAAVLVTSEVLAESDYLLQPKRYLSRGKSRIGQLVADRDVCELGELVNIVRPLNIPKPAVGDVEPVNVYTEVVMQDFDLDGMVRQGSRQREIFDDVQLQRIKNMLLASGDILLGVKGSIGKVAMVAASAPHNMLCGQTMVVLRLKPGAPIAQPEYLLRYLANPVVGEHLESLGGGTALSFIRAQDLNGLEVPILPPNEQNGIKMQHDEIVELVAQAADLQAQIRKNIALPFVT